YVAAGRAAATETENGRPVTRPPVRITLAGGQPSMARLTDGAAAAGGRLIFRRRRLDTLGELFFQPQVVVLPGPVHIHTTGGHAFQRAFCAQRADVGVAEEEADPQDRGNCVNALCE